MLPIIHLAKSPSSYQYAEVPDRLSTNRQVPTPSILTTRSKLATRVPNPESYTKRTSTLYLTSMACPVRLHVEYSTSTHRRPGRWFQTTLPSNCTITLPDLRSSFAALSSISWHSFGCCRGLMLLYAAIATPNRTTLPSMFDFFTNTQPKPMDIWRLPLRAPNVLLSEFGDSPSSVA